MNKKSRSEESTVAAPEYHAGTSVDTNDELYYAKQDFTLTRAWTDQQAVCDFQCAHIDMKVRLEGFDNLSNPQGIIDNLLNKLSKIYNSKKTFILTNGSTSGILAAFLALLSEDDFLYRA